MGEFQRAADDYQKSTELDGEFIFSHIQLAVAQYKPKDEKAPKFKVSKITLGTVSIVH